MDQNSVAAVYPKTSAPKRYDPPQVAYLEMVNKVTVFIKFGTMEQELDFRSFLNGESSKDHWTWMEHGDTPVRRYVYRTHIVSVRIKALKVE